MTRYLVAVMSRKYGSIGIFENREIEVEAKDDRDARSVAIGVAVGRGLETRGASVLKEIEEK